VTRVDSTGLLDAAVATGAVDMPWKLPAPEDGTAAQAGPNGAEADCADCAGEAAAWDAGAELADELGEPLEPQAAAPNATLADRAAIAAILYFILAYSFGLGGSDLWGGLVASAG